jgi:hypothetical protein
VEEIMGAWRPEEMRGEDEEKRNKERKGKSSKLYKQINRNRVSLL